MTNRLTEESSPYLLQHQHNPVDWYPWGDEAFAQAQAEDKPIFVSIGYAACHWCHVMERESFEDEATAALMNELFVNVKVDREERPDVDAVYMRAIHLTGQGGGWPLSAFCTSKGEPFHLGTYYPPAERYGRPSFTRVLRALAQVYAEDRDKVHDVARALLDGLSQIDHPARVPVAPDPLSEQILIDAARWLVQRADPERGGFGSKPKFPSSPSHSFLARASRLAAGDPAREAFLRQARSMARGGIYDHVGGGFARYSTDERWLVPHFEKMLYDNAQLLSVYAYAYAITQESEHRAVIDETVVWLEREMQHASGGLYASLDADSEGEEGAYYVWTPGQLAEVLGEHGAALFSAAYGVTEEGNFEHGTTVLERVTELGDDAAEAALTAARGALYAARSKRVRPATDTKVLSSWNGLTVTGLVRAWQATGSAAALVMAKRVAGFLEREMIDDGGARVGRVWKDGERKLDGTLDDYAYVAEAFMALAEATEEERWWRLAEALLATVLDRFYEEREGVGVFYMSSGDSSDHLVHRPVSSRDDATPSGAAVAIDALVRLAHVSGDARATDVVERYLRAGVGAATRSPFGSSRLLSALDRHLHGTVVVVSEGEGRAALLEAARRTFAPSAMFAGPWAAPSVLAGKEPAADGRAQAYVCRGQTCSLPVTTPDGLVAELTRGDRS